MVPPAKFATNFPTYLWSVNPGTVDSAYTPWSILWDFGFSWSLDGYSDKRVSGSRKILKNSQNVDNADHESAPQSQRTSMLRWTRDEPMHQRVGTTLVNFGPCPSWSHMCKETKNVNIGDYSTIKSAQKLGFAQQQ